MRNLSKYNPDKVNNFSESSPPYLPIIREQYSKVIENSFQVLSILYMGMVQAVDILKISDRLAPRTAQAYREIRSFFPAFTEDTPKYEDIAAVTAWLKK